MTPTHTPTLPTPVEVTANSGNSGTVGSGSLASGRGTIDTSSAAIEVQKRRVSPRFAQLVEEYLKSVSEAETKDGK